MAIEFRIPASFIRSAVRRSLLLLDEDHPYLKSIVLPLVRGIQLEITVLILGDDLKPVVEGAPEGPKSRG
jgi:hypothetical protein